MSHIAPPIPEWILAQMPPHPYRHMVDVGGYHMHVIEYGSGHPVLMLHGNPTWGFLYRNIARSLLGQDFRIILPDLIGLGFSDKPRSYQAHTLENHITWLGNLLDHFNLNQLIFVGQDWGGPIGLGALARKPHLLKGLVILNTALGPPKPGFKPAPFHKSARMPLISPIAFRLLGIPQTIMHRVQGNPYSIKGEVAQAYRFPLKGLDKNIAPHALARMVPDSLDHPSVGPLTKVKEFVEGFQGPAEIIWGKNDPVLGKLLNRTKRMLPHANAQETNGGHFLQEEEAERIADSIRWVASQVY